jgi:hypothetical protein
MLIFGVKAWKFFAARLLTKEPKESALTLSNAPRNPPRSVILGVTYQEASVK